MPGETWERKQCKLTQEQADAFRATVTLPFIDVKGPCPRCNEETSFTYSVIGFYGVREMDTEQEREAFQKLVDDFGLEPRETKADFTVYCRCEGTHDKRPEGEEGCGAYWQYYVEWE